MGIANKFSFADGSIKEITILHGEVYVTFITWNKQKIKLRFKTCWRLVDFYSVGQDIVEVVVKDDTEQLRVVRNEHITNGSGAENELMGLRHFSFISSWGTNSILDIVANELEILED